MLITVAQVVGGMALLYVGGEALVRGASVLASRMGVSALTIGLTVVAFGTSMPELVVSVDAALAGANDISVGNVVGSNIANIALILGLAVVVRPASAHAKVVRVDAPLMIVVSLALVAVMADGRASRLEGCLFLLGLVTYIVFTFWEAKRETHQVQEEFATVAPLMRNGALIGVVLVVVGLALLVGGGHLVVGGAIKLATFLGMSQAAIGLTIVAVGTSLPEAATSIIAAWRGQGDIAIGNVIGSNIFNILGILGITTVIYPLQMGAITWFDFGVMVALAGALAAVLYLRTGLGRFEGTFLLGVFVLYTGWLLCA